MVKKRYKKKNQKLYWENQFLKSDFSKTIPKEISRLAMQNQLQLGVIQEEQGEHRLRLHSTEEAIRSYKRRMERVEKQLNREISSLQRWSVIYAVLLVAWIVCGVIL